ncbi:MAG: hypothetical protein ACUVUC_13160 [Thermoguttaceae bacterium]
MSSRWYNLAVVLLWLTTMGWLIRQKVLPSLLIGEPPNYQRILAAQKQSPPVGWRLLWNDRKLGWAVSTPQLLPNDLTEIRSHVHFSELPLEELIPDWLQGVLQPLDMRETRLTMDARSSLTFDPLGRLSQFESAIGFQPKVDALKLRGRIDGAKMTLWIHCGDLPPSERELPAPRRVMLKDTLSPQSHLPGLRAGQRWTEEAYSPLRHSSSPAEILHATVEERTTIAWNGMTVDTWLVVYRSDPGSALGSAGSPRGRLWVRDDGTILKQQVVILGSTLTFVRVSDEEAVQLARKAGGSL